MLESFEWFAIDPYNTPTLWALKTGENYLAKVKRILTEILKDNNAPIYSLLDKDTMFKIIKTDGKAFTRPWFGQLMTGPQLMAYLCQVNMWLERYNPEFEI